MLTKKTWPPIRRNTLSKYGRLHSDVSKHWPIEIVLRLSYLKKFNETEIDVSDYWL